MSDKKVLIFEDNPSLQTLLKVYFQKRKFEVKIVGDGTEAVAEEASFKPALIVMDLIMPGKDGIEACGDLRKAGVKTPIVMLTSKNYKDDINRGMAAGANAYLLKPFDPQQLDQTIGPLIGA